LHHHGNATGDFDVFDCASHLGFGFGEGLAVFLRDDAGNVVEVIFEQHLQLEQWLDAVFGRRAAPFGEAAAAASTAWLTSLASASGTEPEFRRLRD